MYLYTIDYELYNYTYIMYNVVMESDESSLVKPTNKCMTKCTIFSDEFDHR